MKLLLLSAACVCLIASLHAAAVESVVADEAPVGTESAPAVSAMHSDCQQPKEVGRCFALFHRFAYNAESGECEEFIYGGCGGNTNNFKTKEMCAEKCLTVDAPPTEGPSNDEADAPVASS